MADRIEIDNIASAGDKAFAYHQEAVQEAEVGLYLSAMAKLNTAEAYLHGALTAVRLTRQSVREKIHEAEDTWDS